MYKVDTVTEQTNKTNKQMSKYTPTNIHYRTHTTFATLSMRGS